jgi:hypothetical protein
VWGGGGRWPIGQFPSTRGSIVSGPNRKSLLLLILSRVFEGVLALTVWPNRPLGSWPDRTA